MNIGTSMTDNNNNIGIGTHTYQQSRKSYSE